MKSTLLPASTHVERFLVAVNEVKLLSRHVAFLHERMHVLDIPSSASQEIIEDRDVLPVFKKPHGELEPMKPARR